MESSFIFTAIILLIVLIIAILSGKLSLEGGLWKRRPDEAGRCSGKLFFLGWVILGGLLFVPMCFSSQALAQYPVITALSQSLFVAIPLMGVLVLVVSFVKGEIPAGRGGPIITGNAARINILFWFVIALLLYLAGRGK